MRVVGVSVVLAILLGLVGCGEDKGVAMPSVTGEQLDVAKRAIKDAGVDEKAEVEGGGAFGVVKESNWEVCAQSPAPGARPSGAPRLVVDRTCSDESSDKPEQPAEVAEASEPEPEPVLAPANNKELAALLKVSEPCGESVEAFATKYAGQTIKFDGSIADLAPHGHAKTRYDILLAPGDKGPLSTTGPSFKYEDVGTFDLHLTEDNAPEAIREGDRFRFKAKVGEYQPESCLLFLDPVSTRAR